MKQQRDSVHVVVCMKSFSFSKQCELLLDRVATNWKIL